jgi:hypothetical protein
MSVDGYYHVERILPRHWEDWARKCGYDADRALAHIRDLTARLPSEAGKLQSDCKNKKQGVKMSDLSKLVGLLVDRCTMLAPNYGSEFMGTGQGRIPGT